MFQGIFVWAPTPTMTVLASLTLVLVASLAFVVCRRLLASRGKRPRTDEGLGAFGPFLNGLHSFDKGLVYYGSWAVGSAIPNPLVRRLTVPFVLTGLAAASIGVPEPFGLFLVVLGLLAILIVFRQWSRDEDLVRELAAKDKLPEPEDRDVPIEGDLTTEVVIACAFILVFACAAFAQIARDGLGFQLKPDASPFAFVIYALIDLVKAGPLVDYYDLFAHQLPFDRMSDVRDSGPWAKAAVLIYRVSVNLLLLAVLFRLVEIARRTSEGRDLRALRAMLRSQDADARKTAIGTLKNYALLRGRANAAVELEKALGPGSALSAKDRLTVAVALEDYAEVHGRTTPLYAVVISLRQLREHDFPDRSDWHGARNELATSLRELGVAEDNYIRLTESAEIFNATIRALKPRGPSFALGHAQHNLGNTLRMLAQRIHGADQISEPDEKDTKYMEAEKAFRSAAETFEKEGYLQSYVAAGANIASILIQRAKRKTHTAHIQDAMKVYEIIMKRVGNNTQLSARVQAGLGETLCELAERGPGTDEYLNRAVDVYRSAAQMLQTSEGAPLIWARIQIGLGRALQMLGHRENSLEKLYQARTAIKDAIEILRERNVHDMEADAWKQYEKVTDTLARTTETT